MNCRTEDKIRLSSKQVEVKSLKKTCFAVSSLHPTAHRAICTMHHNFCSKFCRCTPSNALLNIYIHVHNIVVANRRLTASWIFRSRHSLRDLQCRFCISVQGKGAAGGCGRKGHCEISAKTQFDCRIKELNPSDNTTYEKYKRDISL